MWWIGAVRETCTSNQQLLFRSIMVKVSTTPSSSLDLKPHSHTENSLTRGLKDSEEPRDSMANLRTDLRRASSICTGRRDGNMMICCHTSRRWRITSVIMTRRRRRELHRKNARSTTGKEDICRSMDLS